MPIFNCYFEFTLSPFYGLVDCSFLFIELSLCRIYNALSLYRLLKIDMVTVRQKVYIAIETKMATDKGPDNDRATLELYCFRFLRHILVYCIAFSLSLHVSRVHSVAFLLSRIFYRYVYLWGRIDRKQLPNLYSMCYMK